MVKRLLLLVSRCNSAMRAGLPDPVLPRVSGHRTTSAHQLRRWVDSRPLCQSGRGQRKSRHARLITINTVYFVADLDTVCAELARVLRPGGSVVVAIGDPDVMAGMPFHRLRSTLNFAAA